MFAVAVLGCPWWWIPSALAALEVVELRTVDEMRRVLRPRGRLVLADLAHTAQYRDRSAADDDVARASLGWRMWWTGSWASTPVVRLVPQS